MLCRLTCSNCRSLREAVICCYALSAQGELYKRGSRFRFISMGRTVFELAVTDGSLLSKRQQSWRAETSIGSGHRDLPPMCSRFSAIIARIHGSRWLIAGATPCERRIERGRSDQLRDRKYSGSGACVSSKY